MFIERYGDSSKLKSIRPLHGQGRRFNPYSAHHKIAVILKSYGASEDTSEAPSFW